MTLIRLPRLLAIGLLMLAPAAWAQQIGSVKTTSGDVSILRDGKPLPAQVGTAVFKSDRIVTGSNGSVGLTFADNAILSAGPGSVLVLDQFSYDPATAAGNFDVSLRKGTLSAIGGKLVLANPGSMKVKTPGAVLAVRGTEFVVKVENPDE